MASQAEVNSLEFLLDKACATMDGRESSELRRMLYGTAAEYVADLNICSC